MKEYPILRQLNGPKDLQALPEDKLPALAEEIRGYMVDCVSKNGGHLAASLGAVDLIIALHRVYADEGDRLLFDVGHQSYAHKILTGRRDAFTTLRQEGGLSGFPKREESPYDAFNTGHASTSISAALGMARAKQLLHQPGHVAAVIGAKSSEDRFAAAGALFDLAFASFSPMRLAGPGEVVAENWPVLSGDRDRVDLVSHEDAALLLSKQAGQVERQMAVPEALSAPLSPEVSVGEAIYTLAGEEVLRLSLYPAAEVSLKTWPELLRRIGQNYLRHTG